MAEIVTAVVAFVAAAGCVAGLRRWAERHDVLDVPNERSSHTRPTPRGGGLAIAIVTLAGGALAMWRTGTQAAPAGACLGAGAFVAAIGWLDDLRGLSVAVRLIAQAIAALVVLATAGWWESVDVPLAGSMALGKVGPVVTFLWIVGLTNAYNFMDGIDGLAAGQAVIAGAGWAAIGWLRSDPFASAFGALIAGASLGFLAHNWPPARIFMGDVGSTFLGFELAVLPLLCAREARGASAWTAGAGVLLVWIFVLDTALTRFRRLLEGESVLAAHRTHMYQRLTTAGRTHRFATLLYLGLALPGLGLAVAWGQGSAAAAPLIVLLLPALSLALWGFVRLVERRAGPRPSGLETT